ncbi:MAG: toxin YoeB [Bacteroidetes bacterium RIFCSPLOWO2_02_FULL_36_8]|nr:MAG: toxin YoeB [Bacteroidetes bacterium RIFCSPLOWO2_02_FULL_36_8]OFY68855.1 MAG: toxin YoeB [Bacteroidetes bacterium RIFCSPLOWO2_12_FULL_37_12]
MKRIILDHPAHDQYREWAKEDKKIFEKISKLMDEIIIDPFHGTGKPEPLKYQYKGCWSRRIDKVHRLVYRVTDDAIIVISCKYHY